MYWLRCTGAWPLIAADGAPGTALGNAPRLNSRVDQSMWNAPLCTFGALGAVGADGVRGGGAELDGEAPKIASDPLSGAPRIGELTRNCQLMVVLLSAFAA